MAYLSLYRKYRPQVFADVMGQDHVVQTLQNALASGRVASGYLFCGTRGVAKTTIARVLAKSLNCIGPNADRTTPAPEPCNVCAPCKSIAAGQCVDVVEMDAASNRSVNDIAKLRESVQFGPMENRYKTYIVDEAHQLSSDAKDAFLKTLEEPPAGVVFILATTEAHAIPVTIASRCQRFDFKRGSVSQIAQQIARVLSREGVVMDPGAINLVARAAEGSYRDALSLLDQVLAYKRIDVTPEDVAEVLGAVNEETLSRAVQLIAHSDAAGAFALAEQIFLTGKDVRQFLKTLAARLRSMLFLGVGAKTSSEDDDEFDDSETLRQQARQFAPGALLDGLKLLADAERETKTNNQHRLLLEMTLLRLMQLPSVPAEIDLTPVARPVSVRPTPISAPPAPVSFEAVASPVQAEPAPTPVTPVPTPKPVPVFAPAPTSGAAVAHTPPAVTPAPTPVATRPAASLLDDEPDDDLTSPLFDEPIDTLTPPLFDDEDDLPTAFLDMPTTPAQRPPSPIETLEAEEDELVAMIPASDGDAITDIEDEDDDEQPVSTASPAQVAPPEPPAPVAAPEPEDFRVLRSKWTEVVNHMSVASPAGVPVVRDGTPITQAGNVITIEFTNKFFTDRLEKPQAKAKLEELVNKVLRVPTGTFKIKPMLRAANGAAPAPAPKANGHRSEPAPLLPEPPPLLPQENPSDLLDEVIAVFGGRIVEQN